MKSINLVILNIFVTYSYLSVMNCIIKHIIFLFILCIFSANGFSQSQTLYQQAADAYNLKKWKSASTLYYILLKDSSEYSPTFIKAIASGILAGDSLSIDKSIKLIELQEKNFDQILKDLSEYSISTKQFDIFPEIIYKLENERPSKKKELTRYVIKYHEFLRQSDDLILFIDTLLVTSPQNPEWLLSKAKAYQLKGESDKSLKLYEQILELSPYHFQSLLYIGNYYYLQTKNKIKDLDDRYKDIKKPNQAQYFQYTKELAQIKNDYLSKSEYYLEKADQVHSNEYLRKILYDIYVLNSDSEKANNMKRRLTDKN
ncbi:MAG: hypothetical protein Q4F97_04125 [Bacteroidales bacterium]|nr:hypothetical protein [Bacteroidales bacterium]